jgi:hypothetical protein
MRKTILLATTAMVAAVALVATAEAGGRTAKDQRDAEIQELKARLDALEKAQTDQAREEQDNAVQEQTRILKLENNKGWWSNTSISGRMYFDFTNIDNQHNGVDDGAQNGFSMDVKRFYVGIDHTFDSVYSANVTTDFQYSSAISSTELFIKKAYLQAKYDDAFTVRLGAADMPWIPFVEDLYGYRFVEQTLVDRTKFGTSSDWGAHVLGKMFDGMLNYQVSVVNGAGYKTLRRTDSMDVEGRVNLNISDFTLGVGGYWGDLGAPHSSVVFNDASRFNAIAAYHGNGIRLGVEYFMVNDWTHVTTAGTDKGSGWSVFGSYQFNDQWSVFGKYERATPYDQYSTQVAREDFENTYYNFGISYEPVKIVDFALVYKHDAGDNGSFADGNGTIGGTAFAPGNNGDYDEIGLFGQLRW